MNTVVARYTDQIKVPSGTTSGGGIGREAAFSLAEARAKVVVFADMNETTAKASSEESKKYASGDEQTIRETVSESQDP